jgi:hypothetical protein
MVCSGMLTPDLSAVTYMRAGMFVAKVAQAGDRIHSSVSIFPTRYTSNHCFNGLYYWNNVGPFLNISGMLPKLSLMFFNHCDMDQRKSGQEHMCPVLCKSSPRRKLVFDVPLLAEKNQI